MAVLSEMLNVQLSNDKKAVMIENDCPNYWHLYLDRDQLGQLIIELLEIRSQMLLPTPSKQDSI